MCAAFHPSLKDQDGGHAVDGLAALLDRQVRFAEEAVGFGGGQAFVPEMDGKFEMLAQIVGESVNLFRLDAFGAAHAKGQADNDLLDFVFPYDAVQMLEIVFLVLAVKGIESLRSDAQGIGDGDADAACADIETEHAVGRLRHGRIIEVAVGLAGSGSSGCCDQQKGVIPSGAVLQAERRISHGGDTLHARFLGPLVKTRSFGMTHSSTHGSAFGVRRSISAVGRRSPGGGLQTAVGRRASGYRPPVSIVSSLAMAPALSLE